MTDELKKEIIVGIASALFTALFTGIPAGALFWWTWKRDQERLAVEKLPSRRGILIRNRSLFSVYINSAHIEIGERVIKLSLPQTTFPNSAPLEIPSQLSVKVFPTREENTIISEEFFIAAYNDDVSWTDPFMSPKVKAVVVSETGKRFTSTSLVARLTQIFEKLLLAPE